MAKCNACGREDQHEPEVCIAMLRGKVQVLQEVVAMCISQGGLNFHVEGGRCPEDDTCDCPDQKKVNMAMEGFEAR